MARCFLWRVGSSLDLKRAHNPKVAGSNPAPATMNDEALADVSAANPFRLPRLHPGMAERATMQHAWAADGRERRSRAAHDFHRPLPRLVGRGQVGVADGIAARIWCHGFYDRQPVITQVVWLELRHGSDSAYPSWSAAADRLPVTDKGLSASAGGAHDEAGGQYRRALAALLVAHALNGLEFQGLPVLRQNGVRLSDSLGSIRDPGPRR